MSTRWFVCAALAALLTLSFAGIASAQKPPHGPGSEEWEELMSKIALLRNFEMVEALDLDEKTATKLAVYLKDGEEERLSVTVEKHELHREIKEWGDSGQEDKRAKELLRRALELDDREHRLHHEQVEGLADILTPSQQLKFVLVNREFDRKVQELIQDHKREQRREMREKHREGHGPR